MPVLGYITYDDTKIDDSNTPQGSVITALKPYSVYHNLKFYSPTTGELKTWLEANAVKMPLTGTWVFNSTLTNMTWSSTAFAGISGGTIRYLCNGIEYDDISWNADALVYGTTEVYNRDTKTWKNEVYRTITFTQPLQYQRSEEFVRWFVDNAAPPQRHNAR